MTTKTFHLSGLEVREVSLVDDPANQRPFLVVKNVGAAGSTTPADPAAISVPLYPAIKASYSKALEGAAAQLLALAKAVAAAPVHSADASGEMIVPPELVEAITKTHAEVDTVLSSAVGKAAKKPAKKLDDATAEDAAAAAAAEAAAQADGDAPPPKKGKKATKKAAEEAIAAAMAKADAPDIDGDILAILYQQAAKEALRTALDHCYDADYAEAAKFAKIGAEMFARYTASVKSADPETPAPAPVAEGTFAAQLAGLAKAIAPPEALAALDLTGVHAVLTKARSGADAPTQPQSPKALLEVIRKQQSVIKQLRTAPPRSNAQPVGENNGGSSQGASSDVAWPHDLNADYEQFPPDLRFDA